jgi:hypothetical protein
VLGNAYLLEILDGESLSKALNGKYFEEILSNRVAGGVMNQEGNGR